jgi:hypothetical protein
MIEELMQQRRQFSRKNKNFKVYQYGIQPYPEVESVMIELRTANLTLISVGNADYNLVRDEFSALTKVHKQFRIFDLGHFDEVSSELLELLRWMKAEKQAVFILSDDSSVIHSSLTQAKKPQQLCIIDYKVEALHTNTLYNSLVEKGLLKAYVHTGHQIFNSDLNAIQQLKQNQYDTYRLGKLQANMADFEPLSRECTVAVLNIEAINSAFVPSAAFLNPTGISATEICKLTRYLGFGELLNQFHIYNMPTPDLLTARTIAQLLWFFIDGKASNVLDYPLQKENLQQYLIDDHTFDKTLYFYKSIKSGRWWFSPTTPKAKEELSSKTSPCTYKDFQLASAGTLSDRIQKIIGKTS